jgi:hypothetical protein
MLPTAARLSAQHAIVKIRRVDALIFFFLILPRDILCARFYYYYYYYYYYYSSLRFLPRCFYSLSAPSSP